MYIILYLHNNYQYLLTNFFLLKKLSFLVIFFNIKSWDPWNTDHFTNIYKSIFYFIPYLYNTIKECLTLSITWQCNRQNFWRSNKLMTSLPRTINLGSIALLHFILCFLVFLFLSFLYWQCAFYFLLVSCVFSNVQLIFFYYCIIFYSLYKHFTRVQFI